MEPRADDKDFVTVKGLEAVLDGVRNIKNAENLDRRKDVVSVEIAESLTDGKRNYVYPIGYEMYFKQDSTIGDKSYPKGNYQYISTEENPYGEWVAKPNALSGFTNDMFVPIEEEEYQSLLSEGKLDPNIFYFRLEPEE